MRHSAQPARSVFYLSRFSALGEERGWAIGGPGQPRGRGRRRLSRGEVRTTARPAPPPQQHREGGRSGLYDV